MFGIGIDVSKATLDVAVHGEQFRQFSNDKRGFVRLVRWLKTWPIKQVVLEASGGYERAALDVLHAAGLPMVRINPRVHGDLPKAQAVPQRPIGSMRQCWRRWPICYR